MLFKYVSILHHHEAPMDKMHKKRGILESYFQKNVYCQGELPFVIDVKGGERKESCRQGEHWSQGSMSVSINSKGGYCWKIDCH
jgi:hypothetical protein